MRSIAIMAFLALLTVPCIAEPDSVTIGPYNISFDLGMPKEAYRVEIADPKTTESLSGEIKTQYGVELINKTGLFRKASIHLTSNENEQVIPTQDELVQMQKIALLQSGLSDIDVAGRKIDDHDGAASSGIMQLSGMDIEAFSAVYYPSSTTNMYIISLYPWDEGTLSLFKTIHVEKV